MKSFFRNLNKEKIIKKILRFSIKNIFKTLYEKKGQYNKILVIENKENILGRWRFLVLDYDFHGSMSLKDNYKTLHTYKKYFHLGFLFNPKINNVLFIGSGTFTGPRQFLEDYKNIKIDVVEIDPDVVEVAKMFFNLKNDSNLNIYVEDGRKFIEKCGKKYDLIVSDVYYKGLLPQDMLTQEFFMEISKKLTKNGVLISNFITSVAGKDSDFFKSLYKTISTVFPYVYFFRVQRYLKLWKANIIIVATRKSLTKGQLIQKLNMSNEIKIKDLKNCISRMKSLERNLKGFEILRDRDIKNLDDNYGKNNE